MENKENTDAIERQFFVDAGRLGGIKRSAGLTEAQRGEHARKMAQARWDKVRAQKQEAEKRAHERAMAQASTLVESAFEDLPVINAERPFVFRDVVE